jgi:hypothetical protein
MLPVHVEGSLGETYDMIPGMSASARFARWDRRADHRRPVRFHAAGRRPLTRERYLSHSVPGSQLILRRGQLPAGESGKR